MRWLLIPAADRPKARRIAGRIDAILGYPRTHAEAEVTRHGRGPHAATVYTETQCMVLVHGDTGHTSLHGAIAVSVDDVTDALRERFVTIDAVRKRIRQWIADQGWRVFDDLPGVSDAWMRLAPRDGEPGSSTGEPIPEGSE